MPLNILWATHMFQLKTHPFISLVCLLVSQTFAPSEISLLSSSTSCSSRIQKGLSKERKEEKQTQKVKYLSEIILTSEAANCVRSLSRSWNFEEDQVTERLTVVPDNNL